MSRHPHNIPTAPDQTDFAASFYNYPAPQPARQNRVKETAEPGATGMAVVAPGRRIAHKAIAPIYEVQLVKTGLLRLPASRAVIGSPSDAAALLFDYLEGADRERFVALLLNTKGKVIGVSTVSIGDLNSTIVHPREVFKAAILANASSVLVAHNHVSGDPTPSPEDAVVTRRLCEAGELMGIEVLDHVVIGEPGRWVSLKEKGLMP